MASRGTRFRIPRRVKKARSKLYRNRAAITPREWTLLGRCMCLAGRGGWKTVRRHNAHVAMGDTTTMRLRQKWSRAWDRKWNSPS